MLTQFSFLGFTFYSYPLFMGLGIGVVYFLSSSLNKNLSKKQFLKLMLFLFFGAAVGAKLLFLLVSEPIGNLSIKSFVLGGGFVFYGGAIGASAMLALFLRAEKLKLEKVSFILPSLLLSHSIGRIGCYLAGCCHGSLLIPIQLLESVLLFFGFIVFSKYYEVWQDRGFYYYGLSYGAVRFILEFFREDSERGIWFKWISSSQIISLCTIVLCVLAICFNKFEKYAKSKRK